MVALQSLPLRPSTLSTLLRAGFQTTDDLRSSRGSGGLSNFASECNVSLGEAAKLWREVDEAAAAQTGEGSGSIVGSASTTATAATAGQVRSRPTGTPRITAAALLSNPSRGTSSGSGAAPRNNPTSRHIVTFCRSIDALLGGGVALSELTEVSGAPGAGKTQLAMQVCVDARLPRAYGGVEGEAVYIDSEGSFSPERCLDMAESLVKHVQRSAERRARGANDGGGGSSNGNTNGSNGILPSWFNPSTILDGIHVIRVHDMAAQTCAIHNLANLLQSRRDSGTPVRAVVVDSVAFHYRASPNDVAGNSYGGRTKSLTRLAATLSDLAREYDVAVLAVNQMTTRVGSAVDQSIGPSAGGADEGGIGGGTGADLNIPSSRLTPALGESWSHSTTTRLLLTQLREGIGGSVYGSSSTGNDGESDLRRCRLVKCPHKATGVADFQVNGSGIRHVPVSTSSSSSSVERAKRQRIQ